MESVIGCSQTTTAFGLFQEEEEGEFYQPSDTSDVSLEGVEALTEILASEIHIKIISELKEITTNSDTNKDNLAIKKALMLRYTLIMRQKRPKCQKQSNSIGHVFIINHYNQRDARAFGWTRLHLEHFPKK